MKCLRIYQQCVYIKYSQISGSNANSQEVAEHTQPYPVGILDGQDGPHDGHLMAFGFALQGETWAQYSQRLRAALTMVPIL